MVPSKVKTLVIVLVLLASTSIITVGCKQKTEAGFIKTNTFPGQLFVNKSRSSNARKNPNIVYLGSEHSNRNSNFGPSDISFEFNELR